jgi:hypothetical protein
MKQCQRQQRNRILLFYVCSIKTKNLSSEIRLEVCKIYFREANVAKQNNSNDICGCLARRPKVVFGPHFLLARERHALHSNLKLQKTFKGHSNEADFPRFLHKSVQHWSLTLHFEPFRFWIRGDIRKHKTTRRLSKSGNR